MITIKNTQRTIPLDIDQIKDDMQTVLDALDYTDCDLGIWFTTNQTIKRFNRDFRKKDTPTDILSFPYHHELKAGERITIRDDDDKNLGDLIISPQYVQKDALRYAQTLEERLRIILVHGVCHLLGYDHITDEEYAVMQQQEDILLALLKAKTGRS